MPPRSSEFEQEMIQLEGEIKRLEAEYNMFFAGRLPRLPWETRSRVEALVKRYDRMNLRNTAERFRFASLQSRYVKFCELWERHLKAREEGRPIGGRPVRRPPASAPAATPASPPTAAAKATAARHDDPAQPRVLAVTSLRDPAKETERLQELYDRLSAARKEAGEQQIPYDRFKDVVRAQVSKLGTGGSEVAFRVAVQDGKVTLTAKALKGTE